MATAYRTVGIIDYLGVQAMFFPSKKVDGTAFFFADKTWMVEIGSRRWGYRSFNRIDHLPEPVVTITGKSVPVGSLDVVGTRVMAGNQVVGSVPPTNLARSGGIVGNNSSNILGNNSSNILGNNSSNIVGNNSSNIVGNNSSNILSHNGANILSHNGANILSHNGAN